MNKLLPVLFALCLVSCSEREISSTLICKNSTYLGSDEFKSTYLIELDLNQNKVFIKETTENPYYSKRENEELREAGLYDLMDKQYDVEKWTRKFKKINGEIVWREKFGSWTLNRNTSNIEIKRDDGASRWMLYCTKTDI